METYKDVRFFKNCKDYDFTQDNLTDLLEGELVLDEKIYQFLGKSFNFENIKRNRNFTKINLEILTLFLKMVSL